MQLNAEDGGNRHFILVQLPELCDEKSEAYKARYKNICEIGKERIRRAGKKILEEHTQVTMAEDNHPLDVGFRVFKPVSYTHLRAHETGRNLVCRLLLEKKKKKITHET